MFRKMRLESKFITTFWVVPSKKFRKQRNIWGAYHLTEIFGNPGRRVNGKVTFPGGGGAPHMKRVGMLVGNFELNS